MESRQCPNCGIIRYSADSRNWEKYEGYDLINPYEVKKLDAIGNENS
jgi:hypothetical protein